MDVQARVESVKQHLEAFVQSAREKLEQDLPELESFAAKAGNVAVAALLNAQHLSDVPEFVGTIADLVNKTDAALAAAKAQGAAEAQAAAAAAAQAPPAEAPADQPAQ